MLWMQQGSLVGLHGRGEAWRAGEWFWSAENFRSRRVVGAKRSQVAVSLIEQRGTRSGTEVHAVAPYPRLLRRDNNELSTTTVANTAHRSPPPPL
jgi:hypothetical protein